MLLIVLLACEEAAGPGGADSAEPVTGYDVVYSTDPSPPRAGEEAELTYTVVDQLGRPVEDLQLTHERMVHVVLVSRDLASFQHLHHEDYADLTADDLRAATFRFPVTFPAAGEVLAVFDFAHQGHYQSDQGWITVEGEPAQLDAPVVDLATEIDVADVHAALTWDIAPVAGYEAAFHLTLTDAGGDVTDLVPWLGADGHVVIASADLASVSHTHAWYPGMEDVPPGHDMEHLYDGPTLPFHLTFAAPGLHELWVQFARAGAPETPITAAFMVEVGA